MQDTYTDWTLVSLSPWPQGAVVMSAAAVLLACLVVLWSYRGAKRRWLLGVFRLLGALLVLGFLVEPALQIRLVRRVKNRVAVVVDRSRSMALAGATGTARYDTALGLIRTEKDGLAELLQSHTVDWYDLEGPVTPSTLGRPPEAERTDLVGALEMAREAGGGKPLAGFVLISDGADNAELEGSERGRLSAQAETRLRNLGAPVNAVDAAGAQGFQDVAIAEVISDEFAFVHNTFEVEVVLEAPGFPEITVPVTLRRGEGVLATQEAVVPSGHSTRVSFRTKPEKIGEFVYTVSVPAFAGEAVASNNERSFVVQVVRDKTRVLQVAGRPSWDERFLRQHLKENPNVDLISFFILRTPTDEPRAPDKELSLIPFPVEKLFTTELSSFDVVIFQNFDYRPYKMAAFLMNIRDAVLGGLGFVMIGGAQSFADGGYIGTALDEIIPLRLDLGGRFRGQVIPQLTEAGARHPVTDLVRGTGSNEKVWKGLPAWTSLNRTAGLVPGATALAHAPQVPGADGLPYPLVAVMEAGKGRSMAIATDSMWRWRFTRQRDGGSSERAYHRFWANSLRWLVRDPEHSRVRVLPTRRRFDVGEPVAVNFLVLGKDYQPVPYARLRINLERAGAGALVVDDLTTGEGGLCRRSFDELPPGAYSISADAITAGEELGEGRSVFVVEARSPELSRGAPRPDLLEAIAKATGGEHVEMESGFWEALTLTDPDVVEVDRRRNIELWDNSWALMVGILLLGAEWALRRRSGYL